MICTGKKFMHYTIEFTGLLQIREMPAPLDNIDQ